MSGTLFDPGAFATQAAGPGRFSRFFKFFRGGTISQGAAFALGTATAPALRPLIEDLQVLAWEHHAVRPLAAAAAAELVAEQPDQLEWGKGEAAKTGIDEGRFAKLVDVADTAPGVPQLFEAWRRDLIDDAAFEHGLRKAKLEPRWDSALKALKHRLLSLDELANARQQGFIDEARQKAESELQGLDAARAEIKFDIVGLPPGPETMQEAVNRGLTDRATFDQAIREGHTKTKYTDLLFALRRPLLSADEYATLHLKGWISEGEMNAGGALHGFDAEQMQFKYLEKGRPAAPGQLWTAAARGIDGPAGRPVDEAQFQTAVKQSNIRPEYGPMLWDIRYLYPSLFQLTRLVTSGAISADIGADWAKKARYAPEVITALREAWAQPKATAGDTHVAKAQQQLWTTTHRSFLNGEADEPTVTQRLTLIGVPTAEHATILELWTQERFLVRRQLTPAQIRKAYAKMVVDPATGEPWTREAALGALIDLGYSLADSQVFLDEA